MQDALRTGLGAAALALAALPHPATAQDTAPLRIELHALAAQDGACRLTFMARNHSGTDIDRAVYETVLLGTDGGVLLLTLFDFRDLPDTRPRVRQFDVAGVACDTIGGVLINGTDTCTPDGAACTDGLHLESRVTGVEMLG